VPVVPVVPADRFVAQVAQVRSVFTACGLKAV
jgi:hypothetical protein